MTDFEQTLLQENFTLPKARRADVLAFVRYLKLSIPDEELEIQEGLDKSLKSIRARAKKMNIKQEDIDLEIRTVREDHAGRD